MNNSLLDCLRVPSRRVWVCLVLLIPGALSGCAEPRPQTLNRVAETRKQADHTLRNRATKDPIWDHVRVQTLAALDKATAASLERPIVVAATEWSLSDGRSGASVSWIEATPTATHITFESTEAGISETEAIGADDLTLAKNAAKSVVLFNAVVPMPAKVSAALARGEKFVVLIGSPKGKEAERVDILRFAKNEARQ